MLEVKKWAEGKNHWIAFFAPQMAASAQDINQAFTEIKDRRLGSIQFSLPHLPSWFRLYRDHRKGNNYIRVIFEQFSSFGSEGVDFADDLIETFRIARRQPDKFQEIIKKITPEEYQTAQEVWKDLLESSFADIQSEIDPDSFDPQDKQRLVDSLQENELEASFYLLVSVPCWLLYRQSSTMLYRKARLGDFDSLEKLLRLDGLMIHDPAIGKQVQKFRMQRKWTAYSDLIEAVLKKPKARITRKKMKYAMAGFISALAHLLKPPLTEPEIRSLFDAVAKDYQGKDIDTDLPDSPEAFAKAIQRDREAWIKAISPDKKI